MSRAAKIFSVLSSNPKGHYKNITVRGGDEASVTVRVHRFAVVGKGDQIRFGAAGTNKVFVVAKNEDERDIPLTPLFTVDDTVSIGKEKFDIRIREINSELDMRALEFLEQFHYKTNNTLGEKAQDEEAKGPTASVGASRRSVCVD